MRHFAILFAVSALVAAPACAKKKKKGGEPPPVGWYQGKDWPGECFFPKNYEELGFGDRKLARADTLIALMDGWAGGHGNPTFPSKRMTYFETILLGEPNEVEAVSVKNAAFCKAYMEAEAETRSDADWAKWFDTEPDRLTEGDCPHAPLVDTIFQYLDIGEGWQFKFGVCQGDKVTIKGTAVDKYQIVEGGPWIDVEGNGEKATTEDMPCNIEGCYHGQLVMRYTGIDHTEQVIPVGSLTTWTAPGHGHIDVRINDTSFFDNKYREANGLIDHTSITYVGGGE